MISLGSNIERRFHFKQTLDLGKHTVKQGPPKTNHNIGNNSIQDLIIYKKAEKIINSNIDLLQFFIINKVEFKIEFVEAKLREDEE